MKYITTLFLSTLLTVIAGAASPVDTVYTVLSSHLTKEQFAGFYTAQLNFLLNEAPPGLQVSYLDGTDALSTIATLTIPEVKNPRGRAKQLQGDLNRLRGWIQQSLSQPNIQDGWLNTPAVLDKIAHDLPPGRVSVVLLVGTPIYLNAKEPAYSFRNATNNLVSIPSDGMLLADRKVSPFGLAGKSAQLKDVSVHWLVPDHREIIDDFLRLRLQRFWTLFVNGQKGRLVSFGADTAKTHGSLLNTSLTAFEARIDVNDTECVMRSEVRKIEATSRTNEVKRATPPAMPPPPQPVVAPTVSVTPKVTTPPPPVLPPAPKPAELPPPRFTPSQLLVPPPTPSVQLSPQEAGILQKFEQTADLRKDTCSIGVMWTTAGADLDLYVWVKPDEEPLYFSHTSNEYGRYLVDQTSGKQGQWENVVLNQAQVNGIEAWVNLYKHPGGRIGPIQGKVMVRQMGVTRISSFSLEAFIGNNGGARSTRGQSKFWTRLVVDPVLPSR